MTAKQEAILLRDKFRIFVGESLNVDGEPVNNYLVSKHVAKKAALIAIDEILNLSYFKDSPTEEDELYKNRFLILKKELEKL